MARMAGTQVSARVRQWRRVRFLRLRGMFTDNEITQGRLNLVTMRNKALRGIVKERRRLLGEITRTHVAVWATSANTLDSQEKWEEAEEIRQKIAQVLGDARRGIFPDAVVMEAFEINLRRLRQKGKEIRDMLDEGSP